MKAKKHKYVGFGQHASSSPTHTEFLTYFTVIRARHGSFRIPGNLVHERVNFPNKLKYFQKYKILARYLKETLPEAQRTQGIESITQIIQTAEAC